jgi:hypothetical protein
MTNPGDDMTRQLLITRLLAGMRLAGMLIAGTVWLNANCSFAQDAVPPLKLPNVNLPDGDSHYSTVYEQPTEPKAGELQIGVTYKLWLPKGIKQIRGLIVHQHGCGAGSCRGSVTAAHDLHWQELARKNECGLIAPSFHQAQEQNCRLWCDPRNGSDKVFLESLEELAKESGHPEIATVPWCLWGHSGGGFWASLMQMTYPERIVAIWFQSGTAYGYWSQGEIEAPKIPDAAMRIPMVANPGQKEKEHERFHKAWDGSLAMFKAYRAKGAPIAFAPDPRTGHETGDSRYLSIPFFDACLQLRLPDRVGDGLKTLDLNKGWMAPVLSHDMPISASDYSGDLDNSVWLPNKSVASAWRDFVKSGAVSDTTPPPAPTDVQVDRVTGLITWDAAIDFESGITAFVVERDGEVIGQVPEKPRNRYGRPIFQGMSYGDTPELPLLEFQFSDTTAKDDKSHKYRVIAVNSVGLRSN